MSRETKQLAAVALLCFFPLAIIGLLIHRANPERAILLFRSSVYVFLAVMFVTACVVFKGGGSVVPVIGSFF